MSEVNKRRAKLLGMPISSARSKLVKQILFDLLIRYNENFCYRCNEEIKTIRELSIEHKVAWLNSDKPKELFFDLENIAFSHLSCNCRCTKHVSKPLEYIKLKCKKCCKNFKREKYIFTAKTKAGQKDFYCSFECSVEDRNK